MIFSKKIKNNEIKKEIHGIKKWEDKIKLKDSKDATNKYTYDFWKIHTIRFFGDSIYTGKN